MRRLTDDALPPGGDAAPRGGHLLEMARADAVAEAGAAGSTSATTTAPRGRLAVDLDQHLSRAHRRAGGGGDDDDSERDSELSAAGGSGGSSLEAEIEAEIESHVATRRSVLADAADVAARGVALALTVPPGCAHGLVLRCPPPSQVEISVPLPEGTSEGDRIEFELGPDELGALQPAEVLALSEGLVEVGPAP